MDESGFTTTSMVLSLLITLALVFTTAQVYRVNSASAEVQDVADASALSAETQVAEFIVIARFCDAVVLSLSLAGVVTFGLGIAALCTPVTAPASEALLSAGEKIFQVRSQFSDRAKAALSKIQKALPFFAAACAAGVARANNGDSAGADYLGIALLVPGKGEDINVDSSDGADELADEVEGQADDIREKAEEAEEASQGANEAKRRGFERDCGANPGYCMYERAESLAGLSGSSNPLYTSIDTWSFSVALERAKRYYSSRAENDEPDGSSPEDITRWRCRLAFYEYAADHLYWDGYVYEDDDTFDANFPSLPRNTAEMRETSLYTDRLYPVTDEPDPNGGGESAAEAAEGEGGEGEGEGESHESLMHVMHSYEGCPGATGEVTEYESVQYMESANLATCPVCGFSPESLGRVASASTSIDNGFEYHYAAVAEAAEEYERERARADEQKSQVKEKVSGLFDRLAELLEEAASKRIEVSPPGTYGAVAIVVNAGTTPASSGFANGFVASTGVLGPRVAVSASTLIDEGSDEGRTVINSMLDGLRQDGGIVVGAVGIVLDVWSRALSAYSNGVEAVLGGVESGLNGLPLASESGLGTWAAGALREALSKVGFAPAELNALKPVLVNSAHVAAKDEGDFGKRFVTVKQRIIEHPLYSTSLFSSLLTDVERNAIDQVEGLGDSIEIASIELLRDGGPSIPITIPLPDKVKQFGVDAIQEFFDRIRSLYYETTGVRVWE